MSASMSSPPSGPPAPSIVISLQQAVGLHQQGRLAEAEGLYRQVLAAIPDQFDALQLLGAIKVQQRDFAGGVELIGHALRINPNSARALLNFGFALLGLDRLDEAAVSFEKALALNPAYPQALYGAGLAYARLTRWQDALTSFDRALTLAPGHREALYYRALALQALGRDQEALAGYDKALAIAPDAPDALSNRGAILRNMNRLEEALASCDKALAIAPDHAEAAYNRGVILLDLRRFAEALASFDRALAIGPESADALSNRGLALRELARAEEALAAFARALAIAPGHAQALVNRGNALQDLRRFDDALASYDAALAVAPNRIEALHNRGNALRALRRPAEALTQFDQALAVDATYANSLVGRGNALSDLRRFDDALTSCDRALALKPDFADAHNSRGNVLRRLNRSAEALASFDRALAIRPDDADALNNRGDALVDLRRFAEAVTAYERALAIKPDHPDAYSGVLDSALKACDWTRTARLAAELPGHIAAQRSPVPPFVLLGYCDDAALQRRCAEDCVRAAVSAPIKPLCGGAPRRRDRIRLAYLSGDFYRHPVAHLTAELFETHDRTRFDVFGVSFGPDDGSEIRSRIVKSFDRFEDVRSMSDRDIAGLMHALEVDIAVELKGHTNDARLGILAHRPAPIQASYLGYPGTVGAAFIDYLIADEVVVPVDQQPFYAEKIAYLPPSYLVNDSRREIARTPTRAEAGLPERGFVFCCFNNDWKITAKVFDAWMRLLRQAEGSVLWLVRDNSDAETNLRREAAARGIDPARLVFAPRLPLDRHMARHRVADLFLDTLPYNAHTTASDALWAGLPLVTCRGGSFAGRVAASLLEAAGLPELITQDLDAYEALALKLATDPPLLQSFRQRLARDRLSRPLFDTARVRRGLEAAYVTMRDIWLRGERPQSFKVDATSAG